MATTPPLDRTGKRKQWQIAKRAERSYQTRLLGIARTVKTIIDGFDRTDVAHRALIAALRSYADIVTPWARSVAQKMVAEVSVTNAQMWKRNSQEIGAGIQHVITQTPVGERVQQLMQENIGLIRSIPLKAAERVHEIALGRLVNGERSKNAAAEIAELGGITLRRAKMIARTEVSRANASLLQARAESVGSDGYIWRTVGDHDVRESHKELDGRYIRWSSPPTTDGMGGHAGCTPNCRCTAEPVLPGESIDYVRALGRKRMPHAVGAPNAIKPKQRRPAA